MTKWATSSEGFVHANSKINPLGTVYFFEAIFMTPILRTHRTPLVHQHGISHHVCADPHGALAH